MKKMATISSPPEAKRYHELLLEYAGLRRDASLAVGRALGNRDTEALTEATELNVRADLKNKEVVSEGLRVFGSTGED